MCDQRRGDFTRKNDCNLLSAINTRSAECARPSTHGTAFFLLNITTGGSLSVIFQLIIMILVFLYLFQVDDLERKAADRFFVVFSLLLWLKSYEPRMV